MPNNQINDSDVVGGSRVITIGGQAYDTDDFSFDPVLTKYVRTSANAVATGKRVINTGEVNGTATLQYPSSSVARPAFGASFTTTEDGASVTWTIEDVGKRLVKAGEAKIPIKFSANLGTIVLSTVA